MLKQFSFAAVICCLGSSVWAQDSQTVVATVGEVDITLGHVADVYQNLPPRAQSQGAEALYPQIVEQLVLQETLAQRAADANIDVQIDNFRRTLLSDRAARRAIAESITDADVKLEFDKSVAEFQPSSEFNASHILVETQDEAVSLVAQLDEGADFAALATEFSTGPSGSRGGGLGWFGAGAMVPAFEEAVMALEPGAISAPVETQFGWHVIKLNETRMTAPPEFEDVQGQIRQELENNFMRGFIEDLRAELTLPEAPEFGVEIIANPEILAP